MLVEGVASEPLGVHGAADVGDDGAAEVERVAVDVEGHLGRVRVEERLLEVAVGVEGFGQRGDAHVGGVEAALELFDLLRADEGLVALDVDHHVGRGAHLVAGFATAVSAAAVRVGGHDDVAAESLDSLTDTFVVGGHPELVHGGAYAFVDALNHGFTAQVGQRFAGEARRCITRGDNAKEFHRESSYAAFAAVVRGSYK